MRWAERYGKWLAVSGNDVRRADDWLDKHGTKAVFFARLVPGLRSLISIPAGISEMPMPKFLLYSAVGTTLWVVILTALGGLLGQNYDLVDTYLGPVAFVVVGGLAVFAVFWIVRRRRQQKS